MDYGKVASTNAIDEQNGTLVFGKAKDRIPNAKVFRVLEEWQKCHQIDFRKKGEKSTFRDDSNVSRIQEVLKHSSQFVTQRVVNGPNFIVIQTMLQMSLLQRL